MSDKLQFVGETNKLKHVGHQNLWLKFEFEIDVTGDPHRLAGER